MGCTGCGKKKKVRSMEYQPFTVMGGYKPGALKDKQIVKRLATFKKLFCKNCEIQVQCDYVQYEKCRKSKKEPL